MRELVLVFAIAACSSKSSGPGSGGGPLTVDELVAACEIDSACGVDRGGMNVDDCLKYFSEGRGLLTAAQVACMNAAGADCTKALACVGEQIVTGACSTSGCDGTSVSTCVFGGETAVSDCTQVLGAPPGNTCLADATGPKCSLGSCAAGDPDRCDGTVGKRCNAPFVDATDCSAIGATCQLINGTAECTGKGAACTVDRADATSIYDCLVGFEHQITCAAEITGTSPQKDPSSSREFCGVGTACLPWSASATCTSATTVSICAFGADYELDCTSLGFSSCATSRCK